MQAIVAFDCPTKEIIFMKQKEKSFVNEIVSRCLLDTTTKATIQSNCMYRIVCGVFCMELYLFSKAKNNSYFIFKADDATADVARIEAARKLKKIKR